MNLLDGTTEADRAPAWLRWLTSISIVFGIAALVATVWIVGPATILGHLRTIGPWFIVLIAIDALSACFDATAIFLTTRGDGAPTWRETIVAQFAGRAVNSVTPASNLGEALKVGLLARRCPPQRIVAAVMYVALTTVVLSLAVVALGTIATAFWFHIPEPALWFVLGAALAAAGVALAIVVLVRRGMLSTLANAAARLRLISRARRSRWTQSLDDLDGRLRGDIDPEHHRGAIGCVVTSQVIQKTLAYLTVLTAGYDLSAGQLLALISAGVLLGWLSTIVPMGLGISEGGNVALFTLIGAPAALGVALALARRVNQVVFAVIGFVILTADRVASGVLHGQLGARLVAPRAPVAIPPATIPIESS